MEIINKREINIIGVTTVGVHDPEIIIIFCMSDYVFSMFSLIYGNNFHSKTIFA